MSSKSTVKKNSSKKWLLFTSLIGTSVFAFTAISGFIFTFFDTTSNRKNDIHIKNNTYELRNLIPYNTNGTTDALILKLDKKIPNLELKNINIVNLNSGINITPLSLEWDNESDLKIEILNNTVIPTWQEFDEVAVSIINSNVNLVNNNLKCILNNSNNNIVLVKSVDPVLNEGQGQSAINIVLSKDIGVIQTNEVKISYIIPSALNSKLLDSEEETITNNLILDVVQNDTYKNMYKIILNTSSSLFHNNDEVKVEIEKDMYYIVNTNNLCKIKIDQNYSKQVRLKIEGTDFYRKQLNNPNFTQPGQLTPNTEVKVKLEQLGSTDWEQADDTWNLRIRQDPTSFTYKYIKVEKVVGTTSEYLVKWNYEAEGASTFNKIFDIFLEATNIFDEDQTVKLGGIGYYPVVNETIIDKSFLNISYNEQGEGTLFDIDYKRIQSEFSANKYDTLQIPTEVTEINLSIDAKPGLQTFLNNITKLSFNTRMSLKKPKNLNISNLAFAGWYGLKTIDKSISEAKVISICNKAFYGCINLERIDFNHLPDLEKLEEQSLQMEESSAWFYFFRIEKNRSSLFEIIFTFPKKMLKNYDWNSFFGNIRMAFTLDLSTNIDMREINENQFFSYQQILKINGNLVNTCAKVILPYTIQKIGSKAFNSWISLNSLIIKRAPNESLIVPNIDIESGAFVGCNRLNKIDLGDKITGNIAKDFTLFHDFQQYILDSYTKINDRKYEIKIKGEVMTKNIEYNEINIDSKTFKGFWYDGQLCTVREFKNGTKVLLIYPDYFTDSFYYISNEEDIFSIDEERIYPTKIPTNIETLIKNGLPTDRELDRPWNYAIDITKSQNSIFRITASNKCDWELTPYINQIITGISSGFDNVGEFKEIEELQRVRNIIAAGEDNPIAENIKTGLNKIINFFNAGVFELSWANFMTPLWDINK
ncbi:MAG: leucine-rich repeat domain-containing protein [Mycoplasmataceae bacterium]|nr:leucine-rich repeat domain-containing protein [Mycoplasmataceae bacterium]